VLTYVCVILIDFQAHHDAFIQNTDIPVFPLLIFLLFHYWYSCLSTTAIPVYLQRNTPSATPRQFGSRHNYPLLSAIFMFQSLTLYLLLKISACYLHHKLSPSLSQFPNNAHYPSPHSVRLSTHCSVHIRSVEISKHQLTTFTINLIVAPCVFAESLKFINQRMHI